MSIGQVPKPTVQNAVSPKGDATGAPEHKLDQIPFSGHSGGNPGNIMESLRPEQPAGRPAPATGVNKG